MPFTVLLVSGGGFQGLGVLKALRRSQDVRVLVADCYQHNVAGHFADRWFHVPRVAETEAFLSALAEICEREGVRLLLPCTDYEQAALAAARERFGERGAEIAVSDASFLAQSDDKRTLYGWLAAAGLPVLPLLSPEVGGPYPRIGKPLAGWGSQGLRVIHGPEQWQRQLCPALVEDYVWQPLLPNCREYSVDFAIDFDGAPSSLGLRERLRASGGFAVVSEATAEPRVAELSARVVEMIRAGGGRGLFNLQLLADAGAYYVSDLNRRFGTSAVHWCGAGPNPPLFLCRSLDPTIRDGDAKRPSRMVRYLDELWLDSPARPAGIRGVVFDLDDTLIHQKLWMAGKLERLIAEVARAPLDPALVRAEALRLVEEGPRARLLDELAARFDLGPASRLIERYRELVPADDVVFPETRDVLARLRGAGLRLGLLTDNPPGSQRQKLDACGLADSFDAIVFTQELGDEKPARSGFERIAERLGQPARALAMVGDNPYRDGAGALSAGYGAAYFLQRTGTFFNFEAKLFERLGPPPLRRIEDLRGLLLDLVD